MAPKITKRNKSPGQEDIEALMELEGKAGTKGKNLPVMVAMEGRDSEADKENSRCMLRVFVVGVGGVRLLGVEKVVCEKGWSPFVWYKFL